MLASKQGSPRITLMGIPEIGSLNDSSVQHSDSLGSLAALGDERDGSAWEPTPWRAVHGAAREALRKADDRPS